MITYGLCLGGGGARGAYQVGVWKALIELNIKISHVVGASIGAINGAFICEGDYDKLYELWKTADFSSCFEFNGEICNGYKLTSKDIPCILKTFLEYGGLNPMPLRKLLKDNISEETIRKSSVNFGIVTLCVSALKPLELFIEDIPLNELSDYIMASASLPGLKKMIINGESFIDGGIYSNLPSEMLIRKNCSHIIEVDIEGPGLKRKIKNKDEFDIIKIKPKEDLGSILNFEPELIFRNMKLGYLDTLKAFGKLKGVYYYFNNFNSIPPILKQLSISEIDLVLKAIGYIDSFYNNITFFRSLKCLKYNIRNIVLNSEEALLIAMEITAETLNIHKYEIYSYSNMLNEIIKISNSNEVNKKHLLMSNCDITNDCLKEVIFRKSLATTFPKEFISHMFIGIIRYRLIHK